jgi:hypothetical protein
MPSEAVHPHQSVRMQSLLKQNVAPSERLSHPWGVHHPQPWRLQLSQLQLLPRYDSPGRVMRYYPPASVSPHARQ